MRTKNQIEKKWYEESSKWGNLSQKHAFSKKSKYKGYVTKNEHLTGERESHCEGFMEALEWVLNMSFEDANKIETEYKKQRGKRK